MAHSSTVELGLPVASYRLSKLQILYVQITVAIAVRLTVVPFLYPDLLDPWRGHWRFAWEMGMVAKSLATGNGFSSPFAADTGPTAWLGPVYPALMAVVFRLFGLFTPASAVAMLALNSLFSALTCLPIYSIARRTVGEREATWAVWIWALFPYAIYISAGRIWENSLTALLVATLLWYTLVLEEKGSVRLWCGYGALWGFTALCSTAACSLLPPLGLWIAIRRHQQGRRWLAGALAGAALFTVVLIPWEVRNYTTFHRLTAVRDNFWMEVRVGNTGDLSDGYPDWAHPSTNPAELEKFQKMGEIAYLDHMRDVALDFIRLYPGEFVWLTVKRVIFTWTGFWSLHPVYLKNEPFQFPNVFFCTSVTALAFIGLRRLWSQRRWVAPYIIALGIFPLVYYVTHPGVDYRHPIDPVIVILMATGVIALVDRRRARARA